MPLRNFTRPNLPYDNVSLPNDTRFQEKTTNNLPPTATELDAEFNNLTDAVNTLSADIEGTVVGTIPGASIADNANKFVVTDGAGNLSWTKVTTNNTEDNFVTTAKLGQRIVTQDNLGDAAVGTAQIRNRSITTDKYELLSITGNQVANNTLPLSKMRSGAQSALVGASPTNSLYYEFPLPNWYVPSKNPVNPGPSAYPLNRVWDNTDGTFDGAKIAAKSLILPQIRSSGQPCVVGGATVSTENRYYEVVLNNWQLVTLRAGNNFPSAVSLPDIWNNGAGGFNGSQILDGSLSGSKITNNSIPVEKLNAYKSKVPFAMALVSSGNPQPLRNQLNVASLERGTGGTYVIYFSTPALNDRYIVVATLRNNKRFFPSVQSTDVNGFAIGFYNAIEQLQDSDFYFIVYDF
jgi:hypothetical protein